MTLNDADALFPAASVAVHVTGVVPIWKKLPDCGVHVKLGVMPELSDVVML